MFIKTLLLASVAAVLLADLGQARRDQAKVDAALRQLKGEDNEIFLGPEHDQFKRVLHHELKAKKYHKKKLRKQKQQQQQPTLLGHMGENPTANDNNNKLPLDLHDGTDDIRLQDIAFEKEETKENLLEEPSTTTTTTGKTTAAEETTGPRRLTKKEKKWRKKQLAAMKNKDNEDRSKGQIKREHLTEKRREKLELKERMREALSSGMDPEKVLMHFGEESKFPKKFYKKFVKKYQVKKRLGKKTGGAGYRKKAATKKTASETVSKKSWSKAEKKAAKQAVLAERKRQKKIRKQQLRQQEREEQLP